MRQLVYLCLRYRGTVAVLTFLALVLGGWTVSQIPLDVFPEFVPPSVSIQTEAPGFTPQQVEQLITKPIENAVNGAPGIATMRSESIAGLSVITITFHDGANLYTARQGISERLSELGGLPANVAQPRLSPLVSSTKDLLMIGLTSDKVDLFTLRDRADWVLKPLLLAVPGVANIVEFGGSVRQIQIQPDQQKMVSYGFTERDLNDAVQKALPLRGLGFMDLAHQRILIQAPVATPNLQAIENSVVTVRSGIPITLGQLAVVKEAPALSVNDALIMGKRGVVLWVSSQYGANTLATTLAIESALHNVTPQLTAEGITVYPALHRPANFIERALQSLEGSLVTAAILIFVVLFLFFRDWRSAFVIFLAIPLSLTAALIVLSKLGYTLNTMTLAGFAMSLGVLIDDAIIDIENILRRLHQNRVEKAGRPILGVILEGCLEVRGPVVYATLVVVTVFLPELFSSNVQGHFIKPLAVTFILAVLASLAVAMTVTPALCALLLADRREKHEAHWLTRMKLMQARLISFIHAHFRISMVAIGALFASSLAVLPFLGGTLMPDFKEGHFVVYISSLPGTSLKEMIEVGRRMESEMLKLPYIATAEEQVGRAELSEDVYGTNTGELHIELKPDADISPDDAEAQLRQIVGHYPGVQAETTTFLGDRIHDSISGEKAENSIKVFGDTLDELDTVADRVKDSIAGVPGIVDLQFARQSETPELSVLPIAGALSANGLKMRDILDAMGSAYSDETVASTYQANRTVGVALLLPDSARGRIESLNGLMIRGPFGPVPLSQVAHIAPIEGRYSIRHEGGQRLVSVTFNTAGRSLQSVVNEAKSRIARLVQLPPGTRLEFAGASVAEQQAHAELMLYSALAFALIVLILFACFRWTAHAWLVLLNLPFALIGSIFAIAVSSIGLSLGALVGLITVFGVSARNAILLFSHYEHLVEQEGHAWGMETVVLGAQERLIPILLTASMTALGLLPLAWEAAKPGQEISGPMAIAVLGGLISSTILNLLFLPVIAKRFNRPRDY